LVALFESTEAFIQLHEASLDSLKEFGMNLRGRMFSLLARPVVGAVWCWQVFPALCHLAAYQCHGALKFRAMTGEVTARVGVIVFVLGLVMLPGVVLRSGFSMGLVVVVMLGAIAFVLGACLLGLGVIVLVLGACLLGLGVIVLVLGACLLGLGVIVLVLGACLLGLGVIVLSLSVIMHPLARPELGEFSVGAFEGLKFNALMLGGLGAVVSLRPSWQHQAAQKKEGGGLFFHRFVV
jgi:hypothetical protein